MCIILLFYITLCFSLFFPLMGAWLCHANIVQRVKSCYKIKIDSRVLDCCFYGVTRKRIRDASIYMSKKYRSSFYS